MVSSQGFWLCCLGRSAVPVLDYDRSAVRDARSIAWFSQALVQSIGALLFTTRVHAFALLCIPRRHHLRAVAR